MWFGELRFWTLKKKNKHWHVMIRDYRVKTRILIFLTIFICCFVTNRSSFVQISRAFHLQRYTSHAVSFWGCLKNECGYRQTRIDRVWFCLVNTVLSVALSNSTNRKKIINTQYQGRESQYVQINTLQTSILWCYFNEKKA